MKLKMTRKTFLGLLIILCVMLISAFLVATMPQVAHAIDNNSSNLSSAENAESLLNDEGIFTYTITGENDCSGKEYNVTSVASSGFASASNLEKVWLPKSIQEIGSAAFLNCSKLKSITFSDVATIGASAFAMTNLDYLILPESVTSVAATILRNCNTPVYVLSSKEIIDSQSWHLDWNGGNEGEVEYNSHFIPPIQYRHVDVEEKQSISMYGISPRGITDGGYIVSLL